MAKRLVICSDGTWNTPDQRHPTNVVKMARAVLPTGTDGRVQTVFYDQGVGTGNLLDHLTDAPLGLIFLCSLRSLGVSSMPR